MCIVVQGEKSTGKSYSLGCTLNNYDDPKYEGITGKKSLFSYNDSNIMIIINGSTD